jgi:uncharacterized membrane protein
MRSVWTTLCAGLAFLGLYLASTYRVSWFVPAFFGLCTLVLLLEPKLLALQLARRKQTLQITDEGVRRILPGGKSEAIAWSELAEIWILTTDAGPMADDLYFGLVGHSGNGVAVPRALAVQHDLLAHLQKLPGFDNAMVVTAMGSTVHQRFLVWRAATPKPAATLN